MSTIRAAAFVVVVAVLGLTVAPAGVAVGAGVTDQTNENDAEQAKNTSMGAEISEFMQASAADTDHEVETRMFDAAYENADDDRRADIVSDRTSHLEQRLEALESEHSELEEQKAEMNPVVYDARMTRLTVQISALESAVNSAEPRANEYGVASETIDNLRASIGAFANGEITERAGNLIGIEFSVGQETSQPEHSDTPPGEPSDDGIGDEPDSDGDDGISLNGDDDGSDLNGEDDGIDLNGNEEEADGDDDGDDENDD